MRPFSAQQCKHRTFTDGEERLKYSGTFPVSGDASTAIGNDHRDTEMCRFHKMPAVLQNNSNSAFTFMLPVLLKRQHPVRRDAKTFPEHADKIRCAYITTLRGHPVDRQTGL